MTPEMASPEDDMLYADLVRIGSTELSRLNELRQIGWSNDYVNNHFTNQRRVADSTEAEKGARLRGFWYAGMKKIMGEIDLQTACIRKEGEIHFLDLGCCPGGFSSYVLSGNPEAIGHGISLPYEQGGHTFSLEYALRTRYTLTLSDITKFNLDNHSLKGEDLLPSELRPGRVFDLVILDGHHLRTNTDAAPHEIDVLLISQILIALRCVTIGGTLIMKLSRPERVRTAKLLFMLDKLSATLSTVKPHTMHGKRGSFYAIAQGVGRGAMGYKLDEFTSEVYQVWQELKFGGDEGAGRFLQPSDLDNVITTNDLREHYLQRLAELGRHLWATQSDALYRLFSKKGIL